MNARAKSTGWTSCQSRDVIASKNKQGRALLLLLLLRTMNAMHMALLYLRFTVVTGEFI